MASSGTLTLTLRQTLFPNPSVILAAYGCCSSADAEYNQVVEMVEIEWPCEYDYFFTPGPSALA